jgi:hypothetical protein
LRALTTAWVRLLTHFGGRFRKGKAQGPIQGKALVFQAM